MLNGLNEGQDCCRCWVLEAVALAEGREVADNVHFQVAVSLVRLNNGIV